jgi:hypothetical protein
MSIVTIYRGSYSRGKEVAEKLAAELNYGCISREIILDGFVKSPNSLLRYILRFFIVR